MSRFDSNRSGLPRYRNRPTVDLVRSREDEDEVEESIQPDEPDSVWHEFEQHDEWTPEMQEDSTTEEIDSIVDSHAQCLQENEADGSQLLSETRPRAGDSQATGHNREAEPDLEEAKSVNQRNEATAEITGSNDDEENGDRYDKTDSDIDDEEDWDSYDENDPDIVEAVNKMLEACRTDCDDRQRLARCCRIVVPLFEKDYHKGRAVEAVRRYGRGLAAVRHTVDARRGCDRERSRTDG